MEFTEVEVAKLDKAELALYKELERQDEELKTGFLQFQGNAKAFWDALQVKYKFYGGAHYIKNAKIYKQKLS